MVSLKEMFLSVVGVNELPLKPTATLWFLCAGVRSGEDVAAVREFVKFAVLFTGVGVVDEIVDVEDCSCACRTEMRLSFLLLDREA